MGQCTSAEHARLEELGERLLPEAQQRMLDLSPAAVAEKTAGIPPARGSKQALHGAAVKYVFELLAEYSAITERLGGCRYCCVPLLRAQRSCGQRYRWQPVLCRPAQLWVPVATPACLVPGAHCSSCLGTRQLSPAIGSPLVLVPAPAVALHHGQVFGVPKMPKPTRPWDGEWACLSADT